MLFCANPSPELIELFVGHHMRRGRALRQLDHDDFLPARQRSPHHLNARYALRNRGDSELTDPRVPVLGMVRRHAGLDSGYEHRDVAWPLFDADNDSPAAVVRHGCDVSEALAPFLVRAAIHLALEVQAVILSYSSIDQPLEVGLAQ